jgi:hypothetical protein
MSVFMMRVRSATSASRSRPGLRASSASMVGTATMEQWPRSPHSQPKDAQKHLGVNAVGLGPPLLARDRDRGRMDHVRLDAAALEPTREPEVVAARFVGNGDAGMGRPPFTGSSRQRPSRRSRSSPSGSSFFLGWCSRPGIKPATNQLFSLSSTTTTKVLSWSEGGEGSTHIIRTGCHGASPSAARAMRMPLALATCLTASETGCTPLEPPKHRLLPVLFPEAGA